MSELHTTQSRGYKVSELQSVGAGEVATLTGGMLLAAGRLGECDSEDMATQFTDVIKY